VPDEMDLAQAFNEQWIDDCLVEHRRRRGASQSIPADSVCIVCDEPIPAARLAAMPGCTRCIDCQTIFERRAT